MTNRSYTKWTKVVEMLKEHPGVMHTVAEDAGPSAIQALKRLGCVVDAVTISPRTEDITYNRYRIQAMWPTPKTTRETLQLKHDVLKAEVEELKRDVDAADEEYAADRKRLNRSSYRRKQVREKYEPKLEELDHLNSTLRLMDKKTRKS